MSSLTEKFDLSGASEEHQRPRVWRRYSLEEKQEFFELFTASGSVTEAANVLELNRNTCFQWVRRAGLARKRSEQPTREDFLKLRSQGLSRREAGTQLGIHVTTAQEWDTGIRRTLNGRIYADGTVVDYKKKVIARTKPSVPAVTTMQKLEHPIDSRYLGLTDREMIHDMLADGASLRMIGAAVGKNVSTISREIKRNSDPVKGYMPYGAHRSAVARRPRPKAPKIESIPKLKTHIQDGLLKRWSPEQISHKLVLEFPDDQDMRVCHETIYQSLYLQARGGLKREVQSALRTGRTRRKSHQSGEERRSRFRDPMISISERPPEVEDKAVPGHWEGS